MNNLISELRIRINTLPNSFLKYSEVELQYKSSPEKWSKKEILGHLIDSAQNNIRRIVVGQYREKERIVYDQNKWVQAAEYQHYNSKNLIQFWAMINEHFCILLENLPNSSYTTLTDWGHDTSEYVSLEFAAKDYLRHMDHHIKQMNL
ncbi:MAG: DinB family protein [Bacteroidota bacterium]